MAGQVLRFSPVGRVTSFLLSLVALSLYFAQFHTLGWSTRPAGTIRSKLSVTSYIGEGKERSRSHLYGPRPCHELDSNQHFLGIKENPSELPKFLLSLLLWTRFPTRRGWVRPGLVVSSDRLALLTLALLPGRATLITKIFINHSADQTPWQTKRLQYINVYRHVHI